MEDKKQKDAKAPTPADSVQQTDELTQLREILFGQTNRAFKADLSALESRVEENFTTLNSKLDKQFSEIRKTIDEHVATLSAQLASANESHSSIQAHLQSTTDRLQSEL